MRFATTRATVLIAAGFQVTLAGTTTGAAIKGLNNSAGNGIWGSAGGANAFGIFGENTAGSKGTGAGGLFVGNSNDGIQGITANNTSYGVFGRNTSSGSGVFGLSDAGGNGVYGRTAAPGASGVYGENTGGGYGVAGRSGVAGGVGLYGEALGGGDAHGLRADANGTGGAIVASNYGSGPALELHTGSVAPMTVDSSLKVANLNADRVDGASILYGIRFVWSSGGPNAYVSWWDLANPGDGFFQGVYNVVVGTTRPHHFVMFQLARSVGANTSIATVTVTTNAADCVFAAQAVVQPG